MPLQHSSTDTAFKSNVRNLMREVGKSPHVQSPNQALAIAYSIKDRPHRAAGGMLGLPVTGGQTPFSGSPFNTNFTGVGTSSPQPFSGAIPSTISGGPQITFPSTMPSSSTPNTNFTGMGHEPVSGFGNPMPQPSPQNPMPAQNSAAPQCRQFGGLTKPPSPSWTVKNEARSMLHSGPITSAVPGRTDRHNVSVGSGAYVLPADHVSALGQNNTKAGQTILSRMFGGSGPYGAKAMALKHGAGAPKPPAMRSIAGFKMPKFADQGGARGDDAGHPVPIVVAGGEYTIPVEIVAAIGHDAIDPAEHPNPTYKQMIKAGHKTLDEWVLSTREKHIKTLRKLPGPAKA